jgi:hypothetical protein
MTNLANRLAARRQACAPILAQLPPFDLARALAEEKFVHVADLPAERPYSHCYGIADSDHPAWAVWCGEWLVYAQGEEGEKEMGKDLRMWREGAWTAAQAGKVAGCATCVL